MIDMDLKQAIVVRADLGTNGEIQCQMAIAMNNRILNPDDIGLFVKSTVYIILIASFKF